MDEDLKIGKLIVRGVGSVTAVPDTADIGLNIDSRGATPADASMKAEKNIEDVKKALKKAYAPVKGLKTASIEVVPYFEDVNENGKIIRKQNGFIARQAADIRIPVRTGAHLRALTTISKLCPDARTSLTFKVKNTAMVERDALKAATKNAMANAKVLAKTLGVTISGIIEVSKERDFTPIAARAVTLTAGATADINPAEIDISTSVLVTFAITNPDSNPNLKA